jgi:hypothetical protein
VFLEAGQTQRFIGAPDTIGQGIHADQPLRVYASDARGRKVWGEAAPVVRMLVGQNPPLQPTDPESLRRLLEPTPERLLPGAVEPRWKLWKRRELRDPSA